MPVLGHHLDREKHCKCKASCSRTQCNDPDKGSNLDNSIQSPVHLPLGHHASFEKAGGGRGGGGGGWRGGGGGGGGVVGLGVDGG